MRIYEITDNYSVDLDKVESIHYIEQKAPWSNEVIEYGVYVTMDSRDRIYLVQETESQAKSKYNELLEVWNG